MSRLARAIEILEAINAQFQEGAECVYASAYLLDGDEPLKDAIAECLGTEKSVDTYVPRVPRSQQRRVNHYMGRISGWIGKRKVKVFQTQEESFKWLHGKD